MVTSRKSRPDSGRTFRTNCENCGVELVASPHDSGKKATCPECGVGMVIPSPTTEEPREERVRPRPVAAPPARKSATARLRPPVQQPPQAVSGPPQPPYAPARSRRPAPAYVSSEQHKVRAKLVGWYRRVVIVVFALAVVKVFEAAFTSLLVTSPGSLHNAVTWVRDGIAGMPEALKLLSVKRPFVPGTLTSLTSLEHLVLGIGMLIFATRMVIRTKLLDAVYVTTERWEERTTAGLTLHFMALLIQAGVLGWAAAAASTPGTSDGLVCGLIGLQLLLSAAWLMTLHLVAGNEFPELTRWMVINAVFGLAILFVVQWPGVTVLWSRAGATAVLFLADSASALHVGASFVFARRKRRWWWHKPLSIVASIILVAAVALVLACVR
jgi:hypothetical protein